MNAILTFTYLVPSGALGELVVYSVILSQRNAGTYIREPQTAMNATGCIKANPPEMVVPLIPMDGHLIILQVVYLNVTQIGEGGDSSLGDRL